MKKTISKLFLVIAILLFSFAIAEEEEEVIKAGIRYNEATARIELFKDLPRKIEKSFYRDYLKDPNRKENIQSIKNKVYEIDSRVLCPFYFKETLLSYAVTYKDEREVIYYYNIFGNLLRFDVVEYKNDYMKTMGYSRFGNLINVSLSAEDDEQFVYDENGKLIAHWVGEKLVSEKLFKLTRKGREKTEE